MLRARCVSLLLHLALGTSLYAQNAGRDLVKAADAAEATCKQILAHAPPVSADSGRFKPNCDAATFYFGIGRTRDFVAARQCAFAQRAHPDSIEADIFAGPGVLSMVYANGEGVPRNTILARRFVCENRWAAPAELAVRLDLLQQIDRAAHPPHFDLCDTATSGLSEGGCQIVASERSEVSRSAEIAKLTAHLPPSAQTAFMALQKAEAAFASNHGTDEVDLSGSGRVAFEQEAEDDAADQFLADLRSLGQPVPSSPGTPAQADAELNAAYAKLRSTLPTTQGDQGSEYGTLNFKDVQETERSWLRLRDCWMAFLADAYPASPHDAFLVRLTTERTKQLRSILEPM